MFHPLSLCIGLRYLGAKRNNHFIPFITMISTLGIALGVAVLVTVLSIMNGFDEAIRGKIFDTAHHISLQDIRRSIKKADWPQLRQSLLKEPRVLGVAPFLAVQGLLVTSHQSQPVALYGIEPTLEASVSSLSDKLVQGQLTLEPDKNSIILGEQIARNLGLKAGDPVTFYLPVLNKSLLGMTPRSEQLRVIGIFRTGKGFGLDNSLAYIHLKDLQKFYQNGETITGLRLKTDHLYEAPRIAENLSDRIPSYYIISDWTSQYGSLMTAISLEKTMTLWILLLLVAIAAFNLVSSLVMVVTEKKSEIAILRTLGMSTRSILNIFIIQGSLIGIGGTVLGLGCGLLLSQHISYLATVFEKWFQFQLFSGNVFIQTLPSKIEILDFIQVGLAAISMSFIATIYPAWRASKTIPIEALRYE